MGVCGEANQVVEPREGGRLFGGRNASGVARDALSLADATGLLGQPRQHAYGSL